MTGQAAAVTIVAHDAGGIGGMERQLQALISRLVERGTRVLVVSRTLDLPPHPGLRWQRVRGPSRPFVIAYPWFALAASLLLAARRRGVLHTTGAIVLNRTDVCTVHYLHNGTGGDVRREQRSTFLYRVNGSAARAMSRAFEREVFRRPVLSSTLVAVSSPLAKELARAFPSRASAIRVIPNGVDTRRFRPNPASRREVRSEIGLAETDKLALFVGSEWGRKGLDIAVGALAGAPAWQLAVVGRGDSEALLELAGRLGVRDRLQLVGTTDHPERYYAASDALVLPSAYETFSLACFEAAASGLPVIATDVGAVREITEAGGGLLAERTTDAFATALRRIESSPGEAAAMSERARDLARAYDWDAVTDQYLELYRSASGSQGVASLVPVGK